MIRVFLIDDHPVIHRALSDLMEDEKDLLLIGSNSDPNASMRDIRTLQPDVVVLDFFFPNTTGLEVLKIVKGLFPEIHVVIFTMQPETTYAARLMQAGADGYVNKGEDTESLLTAIRRAHKGLKTFSEEITFEAQVLYSDGLLHERLSDREYEIFLLLAQGCRSGEIGERLQLGRSTVSTYISRIKRKTGFNTVQEMHEYAHSQKLL
jgi:DNA-binding NarL/FixJ family response regulator